MRNRVEGKFLEFYESWIFQLEQYLHQLLIAHNNNTTNEIELRALISKLTTHHKAYYTAKWAAIGEDVLAFFGPVWLNPLEKSCFWLTGWKPSTAFRMLDRLRKSWRPTVVLEEAQVKKLEELRVKTRLDEEKIEREMERYQVGPPPSTIRFVRISHFFLFQEEFFSVTYELKFWIFGYRKLYFKAIFIYYNIFGDFFSFLKTNSYY